MNISDSHEKLAREKETEFLSKKIGEYAGHVRHLEVILLPLFKCCLQNHF